MRKQRKVPLFFDASSFRSSFAEPSRLPAPALPAPSLPDEAMGSEAETGAGAGLSANTNTLRLAFTSQESGEVNKQLLVFNCAHLLLCPRACWSAPLHLLLSIRPLLRTSRSNSLSLSLSALLLSFPVQQLICHPFFLNVSASTFLWPFPAAVKLRCEIQI